MISTKAASKAASATIIAVFMAALLFGTWIVAPMGNAATDETNATESNVTIQTYVSCGMPTAWADGVEFGSVDPGTNEHIPNPDENYTMIAPTTNNVGIDFWIQSNGSMYSGSSWIDLGNYTWNMTDWDDFPTFNSTTGLTTSYVEGTQCDNTLKGENCTVNFWLDIPSGQAAGTYWNNVTMKCNQTD